MSGVNCTIVGCSTSYKTKEIDIFKFPAAKMINTKSGGKNGSPKLQKQELLIRCLEKKY